MKMLSDAVSLESFTRKIWAPPVIMDYELDKKIIIIEFGRCGNLPFQLPRFSVILSWRYSSW